MSQKSLQHRYLCDAMLCHVKRFWCPWPESNQHSLRNSILSRARLPIPPQGPSGARQKAGVTKPAEYSGRRLPVNPRTAGLNRSRRVASKPARGRRHQQVTGAEQVVFTAPSPGKTLRCEQACLDSATRAG
jgi:hypothetical protein